jgi:prepilin-type N-terminal cleavage/methylation domain-containing protein
MIKIKKGFTLIELMIVVAIISILAALATAKFSDLISKSKEGHTKAALSYARSALAIYYADNASYPTDDLTSLTINGKYINVMPIVKFSNNNHPDGNTVVTGASIATYITDAGGWAYDNNTTDTGWGAIAINCGHNDIKGEIWSSL